MNLLSLRKDLKVIAETERAGNLQRFFKTGKGEYGEGDIFLGITVPNLRKIAKKYYNLDIKQLKILIASKFHEERLIALFILINKYKTTNHKKIIFHFYIKNTKYINNWDLVDLSADKIVGRYLLELDNRYSGEQKRDQNLNKNGFWTRRVPYGNPSSQNDILVNLAKSENIWERRIAIMATYAFIKNNKFEETLKIAKMLLHDKHDLIHKAVGWMLREVGKRDLGTEIEFLDKYYKKMPRTMLRYAIEKFPKKLRLIFLRK